MLWMSDESIPTIKMFSSTGGITLQTLTMQSSSTSIQTIVFTNSTNPSECGSIIIGAPI